MGEHLPESIEAPFEVGSSCRRGGGRERGDRLGDRVRSRRTCWPSTSRRSVRAGFTPSSVPAVGLRDQLQQRCIALRRRSVSRGLRTAGSFTAVGRWTTVKDERRAGRRALAGFAKVSSGSPRVALHADRLVLAGRYHPVDGRRRDDHRTTSRLASDLARTAAGGALSTAPGWGRTRHGPGERREGDDRIGASRDYVAGRRIPDVEKSGLTTRTSRSRRLSAARAHSTTRRAMERADYPRSSSRTAGEREAETIYLAGAAGALCPCSVVSRAIVIELGRLAYALPIAWHSPGGRHRRTLHGCSSGADVSEGRDRAVLDIVARAWWPQLLDRHVETDHHRSVFTLARTATSCLRCRRWPGRWPPTSTSPGTSACIPGSGALDVVPFVRWPGAPMTTRWKQRSVRELGGGRSRTSRVPLRRGRSRGPHLARRPPRRVHCAGARPRCGCVRIRRSARSRLWCTRTVGGVNCELKRRLTLRGDRDAGARTRRRAARVPRSDYTSTRRVAHRFDEPRRARGGPACRTEPGPSRRSHTTPARGRTVELVGRRPAASSPAVTRTSAGGPASAPTRRSKACLVRLGSRPSAVRRSSAA